MSGARDDRRGLAELLAYVREGDFTTECDEALPHSVPRPSHGL
jgi:hypothetical protein